MSALRVSGPVRRRLGRDADALSAGIGLPADAQCWQCGDAINLLAARPGSVTLSAVIAGAYVTVPAFGHAEHTTSRLFTAEEFAAAASRKPSPLSGGDTPTMLVDGRPVGEAVRIADTPPGPDTGDGAVLSDPVLRQHLLALAAEVAAAGGDSEALEMMRAATGLSFTDPAADLAELNARADRQRLADANRARGAKIYTVRCPSCGELPDLVLNPQQALCGNDYCEALQYAPDLDAFEQLANRTEEPSLVRPGGIPQELADASFAARPVQVRGSAEDDGREAEIRDLFHRWGYTCADPNGSCAVCGWNPTGA